MKSLKMSRCENITTLEAELVRGRNSTQSLELKQLFGRTYFASLLSSTMTLQITTCAMQNTERRNSRLIASRCRRIFKHAWRIRRPPKRSIIINRVCWITLQQALAWLRLNEIEPHYETHCSIFDPLIPCQVREEWIRENTRNTRHTSPKLHQRSPSNPNNCFNDQWSSQVSTTP